jgi:hypothetical protein
MYKLLGLSASAIALAAVTFWATLVTDPPKTEAETTAKFDIGETLKTARQDASIQDTNVIGCTFVLTDGHRCD